MIDLKKACLFLISFALLHLAIGSPAGCEVKSLTLLNWSEYIDPDLIKEFEKKHNAKVKELYYETDETKEKLLLEAQGDGYDLVLSSGMPILHYIKHGWLEKISTADIPNLEHIDTKWREARPEVKDYAAPYTWGTTGIVYRQDMVKKNVTSWMDFYRPSEELRKKIVMINDSKEAVGMGLVALGYPLNSTDKSHYDQVRELLLHQKPYVFDYSYVSLNEGSALVKGDIAMAMVYNGDGLVLEDLHPQIKFVIPKEGTSIWMDYLVIMKKSKNKPLAKAFINFLNEPKNAARLSEYLMFASPNRSAQDFLPKEFRENPKIYPNSVILQKSEVEKILPPRIEKKRISIFYEVNH